MLFHMHTTLSQLTLPAMINFSASGTVPPRDRHRRPPHRLTTDPPMRTPTSPHRLPRLSSTPQLLRRRHPLGQVLTRAADALLDLSDAAKADLSGRLQPATLKTLLHYLQKPVRGSGSCWSGVCVGSTPGSRQQQPLGCRLQDWLGGWGGWQLAAARSTWEDSTSCFTLETAELCGDNAPC